MIKYNLKHTCTYIPRYFLLLNMHPSVQAYKRYTQEESHSGGTLVEFYTVTLLSTLIRYFDIMRRRDLAQLTSCRSRSHNQ